MGTCSREHSRRRILFLEDLKLLKRSIRLVPTKSRLETTNLTLAKLVYAFDFKSDFSKEIAGSSPACNFQRDN